MKNRLLTLATACAILFVSSSTAWAQADAYASALLTKAGIGTAPQKSLFQKLDALTKVRGAEIPVWLRSHPHAPERIAAIEANEARWGA